MATTATPRTWARMAAIATPATWPAHGWIWPTIPTAMKFLAACAELHKDEHDPEFMFQDWEGIPAEMISESYIEEGALPSSQPWTMTTARWSAFTAST